MLAERTREDLDATYMVASWNWLEATTEWGKTRNASKLRTKLDNIKEMLADQPKVFSKFERNYKALVHVR